MGNKGPKVKDFLADLGLSTAAAQEVRSELIKFRRAFAERYDIDLAWPSMQDPHSDRVQEMARTYFEYGLPKKGIFPGKTRWTINVSAAQTGEPEYTKPKHILLDLLQKLIAFQNHNYDRHLQDVGSKEETSSSDSGDSEQNHTVGQSRGRVPGELQQPPLRGTRSGLRSGGWHVDEGSTEDLRVAPLARIEPDSGLLARTGRYGYGGLPNSVDLEAHEDHTTMTSVSADEPRLTPASQHTIPDARTAGVSPDAEVSQSFLSGLAHRVLDFEGGLGSADDATHQHSTTREKNSASQECVQQSNLEQTAMHKRRAAEDEPPQTGNTLDSPSWTTLDQNERIDEGRKRMRLEDEDSHSATPQPNADPDSNNSDVGYTLNNSVLPAVQTHQDNLFRVATKSPDNGADRFSPKERPPTTGSKSPSASHILPEQEQADQRSGGSKAGPKLSVWLRDPRKPGVSLESWPGKSPLSRSFQDVFEKTTELLETDSYGGIQFLFELGNEAGELKFRVAKCAPEEFQRMKENAPMRLKKAIKDSEKKPTVIELILKPLGLVDVGSSKSARTETTGDEEGYGIDALFE